jgi:hypothetical protein
VVINFSSSCACELRVALRWRKAKKLTSYWDTCYGLNVNWRFKSRNQERHCTLNALLVKLNSKKHIIIEPNNYHKKKNEKLNVW